MYEGNDCILVFKIESRYLDTLSIGELHAETIGIPVWPDGKVLSCVLDRILICCVRNRSGKTNYRLIHYSDKRISSIQSHFCLVLSEISHWSFV